MTFDIAEAWTMLLARWPLVPRRDMASCLLLDTLPLGARVAISGLSAEDEEPDWPAEVAD